MNPTSATPHAVVSDAEGKVLAYVHYMSHIVPAKTTAIISTEKEQSSI